jgi:hypothetical protein
MNELARAAIASLVPWATPAAGCGNDKSSGKACVPTWTCPL